MIGPGDVQRGFQIVSRTGVGDILVLLHSLDTGHVPVAGPVEEQVVHICQLHAVVGGPVLVHRGGDGDEGFDGVVVVEADGAVLRVAVVVVEKAGGGYHLPAPGVAGNGDAAAVQRAQKGMAGLFGAVQKPADVLQKQHRPPRVLPGEHVAGVLIHRGHRVAVGRQVLPQVAVAQVGVHGDLVVAVGDHQQGAVPLPRG